jgi:hypothetical protein
MLLGAIAGGFAGTAVLLYPFVSPQLKAAFQPRAIADLFAASPSGMERTPRRADAHDAGQLPAFDMTIRRGERGRAPFPVRLVGAEALDNVTILLRGLPPAAALSNGWRRDDHTWVLRLAELDGLHVILGKGTPDTFDVTIEVTSKGGASLAKTIARVRLVDAAGLRPAYASLPEASSIPRGAARFP